MKQACSPEGDYQRIKNTTKIFVDKLEANTYEDIIRKAESAGRTPADSAEKIEAWLRTCLYAREYANACNRIIRLDEKLGCSLEYQKAEWIDWQIKAKMAKYYRRYRKAICNSADESLDPDVHAEFETVAQVAVMALDMQRVLGIWKVRENITECLLAPYAPDEVELAHIRALNEHAGRTYEAHDVGHFLDYLRALFSDDAEQRARAPVLKQRTTKGLEKATRIVTALGLPMYVRLMTVHEENDDLLQQKNLRTDTLLRQLPRLLEPTIGGLPGKDAMEAILMPYIRNRLLSATLFEATEQLLKDHDAQDK